MADSTRNWIVTNIQFKEVEYTPTFTSLGTCTNIKVFAKREGNRLKINGHFTVGTPIGSEARMTLPFSLVSDATIVPTIALVGKFDGNVAGAWVRLVLIESNIGYITFGNADAGNAGLAKRNGSSVFNTGEIISFYCDIPISTWNI